MAEYETDKCPTCGHERRGRRVIRLSAEHAEQWKTIQRHLDRNVQVTLLGGVLLGIVSAIGVAFTAWWYLPLQLHWGTEAQVLIPVGAGVLGWVLSVFLVWLPIRTRRDRTYFAQRNAILTHYGIGKVPDEPYVVVTE